MVFRNINNKYSFVLDVTLGDDSVSEVHRFTFLGLIIDRFLFWEDHCRGLMLRLDTASFLIRSMRGVFGFHSHLSLYYGTVY